MRLLLDTHVLLWWLSGDTQLGERSRDKIEDPAHAILVSAASMWEIVIKQALGKLEADIAAIEQEVAAQGFERLGIEPNHLIELNGLPHLHRDPFDRMLVAQARAEGVPLMTTDRAIAAYLLDLLAADR